MYTRTCLLLVGLLSSGSVVLAARKKAPKTPPPSPLDQYVNQAMASTASVQTPTGSLWAPTSRFMNLGGDFRASQVNDILTIVVSEQASAVAQGTTKTQRQSTLSSSITAAGGPTKAAGALANLANLNTQSALNGQGATTRSTTLNTTLTAHVTQVLPNGYLVIEASKEVDVNAEHQLVTVRGVVRPFDLSTANVVSSNQIADMELKINGKGVVNDAVRRPMVLWRLLMGILPF
ncbi:MAG TPA: flagellar basal body L-ring protein FlgH [Bryobacteraceae bacterium]|nr:flagellar basal body L-ring protein FlgH [Bryobacteraceae bacterium]